jgi:hypothetical protein
VLSLVGSRDDSASSARLIVFSATRSAGRFLGLPAIREDRLHTALNRNFRLPLSRDSRLWGLLYAVTNTRRN